MGPVLVVFGDPHIKVGLQLVDRAVDLFAERHPVKLIQAGCSIASATTACSISIGVRFFRIGFLRLISCNANSPPLSYSSLNR